MPKPQPHKQAKQPKTTKTQLPAKPQVQAIQKSSQSLLLAVRQLIDAARAHVATAANSTLTQLYWQVGRKIATDMLTDGRAAYGQEILPTLSAKLVPAYGKGFSERNLARMVSFVQSFPDAPVVATLSRELSWSHFIEILPLKAPLERAFYTEMCRVERWSVRTLRERMASQLYLRSAIAKQPESVIASELGQLREGGQVTPDLVFRDPYMLDFLGLPDGYSERDLESAILRDMERFLLELGAGFTFVARQKRISVGADDFYLDLLFYHRHLRRLVAVELKLEKFSPSHKGQMELYLRWLDQNDRAEGEASPIGLILCASTDAEQVELMDLDSANIRVAQYLHALPELQVLQTQLHRVVQLARERQATLEWPDNKEKT